MSVSTAARLTKQFYEWEKRGRGYTAVNYPAELEPPFIPFFGHAITQQYIDDGKAPTLFSRLKEYFIPEAVVEISEMPTQPVVAFEDTDETPALTIFSIILPKNYTANPHTIEQCYTMLAMCKQLIVFELIASASELMLEIVCKDVAASFIYTQLTAYFPECTIREVYDDKVLQTAENMEAVYIADFGLAEEFMRPLAQYGNSHLDPYTPLFSTFQRLKSGQTIILQVLFCGTINPWSESILKSVSDDTGHSFFIDAPEMPLLAKDKISRPLFGATARIAVFAEYLEDAAIILEHSALGFIHASTSPSNSLLPLCSPEYTIEQRLCDVVLRQSHRLGMLLNTKELATLAHFPHSQLSQKILQNHRTTKQAPASLKHQAITLGVNEHQGQQQSVSVAIQQMLTHCHIIGGSGTGKTTFLQTLIYQNIANGIGCCVLDPHGDLIEHILRLIPKERIHDVVLIDPSDRDYPVSFNILSAHTDLERELLASDLVALFKRFSSSWGDQLHSVLANAIMSFLYNRRTGHLGDLRKFLIEPQFRAEILATCTDTELIYYWNKEYPLLKTSSIGSILTRLDTFLRPKVIRQMVCQEKGLDFSTLMDEKKVILVKLSQGLIGAENSYLLGACIVAKIQQAAMARQQQASTERTPFFCYIDEFQQFITPSMNAILSGARKYSLGLVLAHQDMQAVQRQDGDIVSAIMTNVGVRVCFRLSDSDAKRMQDGFNGFTADDLQNLETGEAIARVNTADAAFNLSIEPVDSGCPLARQCSWRNSARLLRSAFHRRNRETAR